MDDLIGKRVWRCRDIEDCSGDWERRRESARCSPAISPRWAFDLLLTARRADRLEALASELRKAHGVRAEIIVADLATTCAGIDAVRGACAGRDVDLLVNNAGFASYGLIHRDRPMLAWARKWRLTSPRRWRWRGSFLPGMVARGSGGIINVASTAAFQPTPRLGVYGATKAFLLNFSEALWAECRGTGVRVLALCPGQTKTEFFSVAGEGLQQAESQLDSPEEVVRSRPASADRRTARS